jgi:hypothetical protein
MSQNQFGYSCPACGDSACIDIAAVVWVRLTEDGSDADISEDGSHEWDGTTAAKCCECGWTGTVAELNEEPEAA